EELTELVPNSEDIVDIVPNNYPDFCDIGGGGQETALFFYHPDHLGSTGMVTDNSSNITQGFLYAPFGEIITEFNPSWESGRIPKYSFNAKELDEENGMYYYSARYYAPPTFISRDPMFEKYPSISPYTYCSNNPVKRIDPNGEDDYEVDRKTGELILLKKTDEKTDRLVGQNWLGKVKQNKDGSYKKSIEIDKSVLQNREVDGLNQKMDFGSGENAKNKAIDVFNFLSDNTDVEWSALGYGTGDNNQNSITTGGSADIEPRVTDLINKIKNIDINYFYHNHPGNDGADYPSTGQSGERGNDLAVWKHIWKNNPNAVMGIRAGKSTQQYKYNPQNSKGYSPIIRH
ncbi:MAG: RHS repeat-associated core domain-containing protein, partial [Acidimicrobiia bacterium]